MFDENDGGGGGGRVSVSVFLKMGQSRPPFVIYFRLLYITQIKYNELSILKEQKFDLFLIVV